MQDTLVQFSTATGNDDIVIPVQFNTNNEETTVIRFEYLRSMKDVLFWLAKILKKYDKRTGRVLRLPFIQKVLQQPFFTTDLISKLVKECESTIESVFPQWEGEEEVVAVPGDGIFRNTVATLMTMQENIETLLAAVAAQQGFGDDDEVGNSAASAASRAVLAPGQAIGRGKRRRGATDEEAAV
ncbi:hypothetical protein SASPL_114806 [Salvia splendens]|uniref:Uncharacterized protein n=1 Tax=Salvia splendens TaxID=180675 RepID=A0A8X8Y214_SALSN|nr:hypothetical protein SASPL_114806 [Salvia splendens]